MLNSVCFLCALLFTVCYCKWTPFECYGIKYTGESLCVFLRCLLWRAFPFAEVW